MTAGISPPRTPDLMDLLILLALILLNGVFAMSEMSVVAARKSRLQQWVDEGRPGARTALVLANEPGHFLSTIQVGITVIGVLTGAIGGATVAQRLEESLAGDSVDRPARATRLPWGSSWPGSPSHP